MKKPSLTDKRLADKRFRRTEEAILQAFFESRDHIGVVGIAKKAGVARSTVYGHHRTAREIVPDYERYILRKFRETVKKMDLKRGVKIETVFTRTLVFIVANKRYFSIVLKGGDKAVFGKMVDELKELLVDAMKVSKKQREVFAIYGSEIAVIMSEWCVQGFCYEEIGRQVDNMAYLTRTARMRLGALE